MITSWRIKFDVEVLDLFDVLGLHDRHAIDEVLGLDQHAADLVKYMA